MMNAKALALGFTLVGATFSASAGETSAAELLRLCAGEAAARATCDGYLMAAIDLNLLREYRNPSRGQGCVPENITVDQVRDSLLRFATAPNAKQMHRAVVLVFGTIKATWPCPTAPEQR